MKNRRVRGRNNNPVLIVPFFFFIILAFSVKVGIGKVAIGRVRYLLNIVL
jgi:hypothetical protein